MIRRLGAPGQAVPQKMSPFCRTPCSARKASAARACHLVFRDNGKRKRELLQYIELFRDNGKENGNLGLCRDDGLLCPKLTWPLSEKGPFVDYCPFELELGFHVTLGRLPTPAHY